MEKACALSTKLTAREVDVLVLVCEGMMDGEIAAQLNISEATVKRHGQNIRDKIGMGNRVEMVLWAIRYGLIKV